jgi:hypothetical protein
LEATWKALKDWETDVEMPMWIQNFKQGEETLMQKVIFKIYANFL